MCYVVEHYGLLAVPSAERSEAEGIAHPKHIVAEAQSLLFVVGLELCLSEFQAFAVFAVDVYRLAMVEIDAVAHQFALEGCPVVV